MGGGSDNAKMLGGQIEHLSHSQNLTDESHECWSLHVAAFMLMFSLFTKLFSAVCALVSSYMTSIQTARGLLNVLCPFLKCCTVTSIHASQNPSLWFALLPSPHVFRHLNVYMKTPAPFCSSLRSINRVVQVAICESWHWISLCRPWSSSHL